jgi:hypothetical protein
MSSSKTSDHAQSAETRLQQAATARRGDNNRLPFGGGSAIPGEARLDRAVLSKFGKGLQYCFDELHRRDVSEHFKFLIDCLTERVSRSGH